MPLCVPPNSRRALRQTRLALGLALAGCGTCGWAADAPHYPITPQQRATAQQVAQAGVPLSELAAGAPDSYTVKAGDTLWDISKLFLTSPWRWPELWGMNREQIRNPHLIYPGQTLELVKMDGRASLRLAGSGADGGGAPTVKLSPRVRASDTSGSAIAAIPLNLIEPFLNEAVVFDDDALARAPRIIATDENHVLMSRGDRAYALGGDLSQATDYRVFRNTKPLLDPSTKEILGYEAPYLGTAELTRPGGERTSANGKTEPIPATLTIKTVRQDVGIGDRLSPVPQREFSRYIPHPPSQPINGQIVSIYGEAIRAGQNQIVALNRGAQDGVERGHVLALWKAGRRITDRTGDSPREIQLPDERQGVLFVFQVYQRVSYALIISVQDPVDPGDRFTQP